MTEYRVIMAGLVLLVGMAPLTTVWPVLDTVLLALLLTAAVLALAGYWLRDAVRELRFRLDMRALDAHPPVRPEVLT